MSTHTHVRAGAGVQLPLSSSFIENGSSQYCKDQEVYEIYYNLLFSGSN